MKILKNFLRCILFLIGGILGLVLLFIFWFYASCPIYTFKEAKPFSGPNFYNPYQDIDSAGWKKCIFHLHEKSWGGITNGSNTGEEINTVYKKLRYDVIEFSNYMSISKDNSDNPFYIPVYEHGYNIRKTHQLALGASKVLWRDYFFLQNLNHKQHIIDMLKQRSTYVSVNHPNLTKGYLPEDFKYLSNYDLFEVLNRYRRSETEWDAALSNGHQAWLIANDDAHSVNDTRLVNREVTFVNVSDEAATGDDILKSLVRGVAFGVHFPQTKQMTFEEKETEAGMVSYPVNIEISNDTLFVFWERNMQQFEFIGDSGRLLKTDTCSNVAFYPVCSKDSYVRVKITSPEGFVYYLNPIIRYEGDKPVKQSLSSIDSTKTVLKRIIIILIVAGIFFVFLKIYRKKKRLNGQKSKK